MIAELLDKVHYPKWSLQRNDRQPGCW